MGKRSKVFVFAAMPPPVHGMALVNKQMAELIGQHADATIANISPGSLNRGTAYHAQKLWRVMVAFFRLIGARIAGCKSIYGAADENLGGLYTVALILFARVTAMRIFLHHHSYRYLSDAMPIMQLLTKIAGPMAGHIVLGKDMDIRLRDKYPTVQNTYICGNSVHVGQGVEGLAKNRPLTIGMMANLTAAKGLPIFLETLAYMVGENLKFTAVLAGPVPERDMRLLLEKALSEHAGILSWRGPVSGADKDQFFADIDYFLFPTQFKTEAYPLVLLEALVCGANVISYDRGCINELEQCKGVKLIPTGANFAKLAYEHMTSVPDSSDCAEIAADARRLNDHNLAKLDQMAGFIAGVGKYAA
jgi:glycosyltransferase involved in cell wall biosynthesis